MIDQVYLKEALRYDPDTGKFKWREDRPYYHFKGERGRRAWLRNIGTNLEAGSVPDSTKRNPSPYQVIGLGGKQYKAHRLAWLYVNGEWPDGDIDHINQDTLDNRISNLRISVDNLNHRNRPRYRNNTTGVNGVSWLERLGKWQAEGQTTEDGKRVRHYLGVYGNLLDACAVRKSWENRNGYTLNHGERGGKDHG